MLRAAVEGFDHSGLCIEIKYCPAGSSRFISGTYYVQTEGYPDGRLIRLRINRDNTYPIRIHFKTSDYFKRIDKKGAEITYQRLRYESFNTPEDLLLAIFLHEFSHYMDHMEGRNGRYKQTKADKFAIARLEALGIVGG